MADRAPIRDVVRVLECERERGGLTKVLVLTCGCFVTRRTRKPPPRTAPCIACFARSKLGDDVRDAELRLLYAAEMFVAAPDHRSRRVLLEHAVRDLQDQRRAART